MDDAVKLAEVEQRARSNTRRIEDLEKRQDNLDNLATTMSVMSNEQEHIKTDVSEIKTNVKILTDKPGKRWESVIEKLVWLIVSGAAGYLMAQMIK